METLVYFKKMGIEKWAVEDIQNMANLIISSIVSLNLIYYSLYEKYLTFSIPFIFTHFVVDFFYCNLDIKLHHFFGVITILFKIWYQVSEEHSSLLLLTMYKTEISTFFYVFKLFLQKMNLKQSKAIYVLSKINDLCFFISFFKLRIYDYYVNIVSNPAFYLTMENYYIKNMMFRQVFLYTGICGLYFLNVYWFSIMCKIIFKPITSYFDKNNLNILTHQVVSYTYFFNTIVSGYIYSLQPNQCYIFDMIGIFLLGGGSHYYHKKCVKYISKDGAYEYTSYSIIKPFFVDKVSIHLRSVLCLTTCIYNSDMFSTFLSISIMYHTIAILQLLKYLYSLKKHNEVIYNGNNEKTKDFIMTTNFLVMLPVSIDIILVGMNSYLLVNRIHLFSISLLIGIILHVEPFYELTHIAFHLCLIVQSMCISLCNLR
jgi:hypothetical protein